MSLEKSEELRTTKSKKKPNKGPYLLGETLGEGAFAKVRLATQIHIKEKCAIKIVDKRLLEGAKDIQRLKKEIKILKSIRQKNIIQLFDVMESKKNLYFVLEYCKGGELFDYIVKNKRLKEPEACVFFQQIINGVDYLHKQGIIHRDLKPENLLLDYNNNIKISDFGLSTFFSKNNYLQTACGTPSYAPPEMLEGLQYNGEASDIWSCGIILYAMLCGTLPFTESKEEIIVRKIKMHDYSIPKYLSKEAQDMLNHILKIKPEERFTIEGIKNHPWFNIVTPHLIKGISIKEIRIPVDDNILEMVKNFGFDKEECKNLLLNNKFCSLTSIYYLCLKKFVREGGKSISDLESDLYEEYINNPNNYINQNDEKKTNENLKKEKEKNYIKDDNNMNKNTFKNKNNLKEKNGRNIEESKAKGNNTKNNNNDNINNGNKKTNNNKEINVDKKDAINNNKDNNNETKKKININKKEKKIYSSKNNQQISNQKKTKDVTSTKISKKNTLLNNNNNNLNKPSNKNVKNNILIQDKKSKNENAKNQFQQIMIKNNNNNNEVKTCFPSNRNKNKSEQNKCNTIIIKKKLVNKSQNNQQKKFNVNEKKSPKRYIENNNIKNNSLVNSFNTKNKSLEHNTYNDNINKNKEENGKLNNNISMNNKYEKLINIKDNNKEKKQIDIHMNEKNIIHSNTITGNTLNNNNKLNINISGDKKNSAKKEYNGRNIHRGTFALGVELDSKEAMNIIYEQNKAKEAFQKYRNCLREGNPDTRNKSSPFPIEQFGLDKDIDENILMEGQKPLNVINYIAKKLVSSSFCGSFNFQYSSAKKYSTTHRASAMVYSHLISNSNLFINKESNPINEEIEYIKENNEGENNGSNNNGGNNNNNNDINQGDERDDTSYNDNNINDINFKNLVSILNQKFKKYLAQNNTDIKQVDDLDNNISHNYSIEQNNISSNKKNKKINFNIVDFQKNNKKLKSDNNNISLNNNPKIKFSKNIDYKEDSYSNSFNKKIKNDLASSTTHIEAYAYNINNMTSHYNKFLDISTNYDPGIDSRGESSIERGDSHTKNELRNFSFSLDKKHKKRGDYTFRTEYNEKGSENNYNVIKNTLGVSQNKFNKNINIISENEELSQNTIKNIKNNKSNKNKYCPFLEKKVSINLSTTFNNLSKSEKKQKKK